MSKTGGRRTQWLKGVLEPCTLATMSSEPRYGYEIRQILAESGLVDVGGGTLYPVLGRLEDAGLVIAEWRPGEGGPARKYYELTPTGREVLSQITRDWDAFTEAVGTILQGTFVSDQ